MCMLKKEIKLVILVEGRGLTELLIAHRREPERIPSHEPRRHHDLHEVAHEPGKEAEDHSGIWQRQIRRPPFFANSRDWQAGRQQGEITKRPFRCKGGTP